MFSERTSVGLDVHARSIVACGLDTVTGQTMQRRLVPSAEAVFDWLRELPAPIAVAYEAGPTGFDLARQLTAGGVRCVVAAPSKLQRPAAEPGRDRLDAVWLASLAECGLLRASFGGRRACPHLTRHWTSATMSNSRSRERSPSRRCDSAPPAAGDG